MWINEILILTLVIHCLFPENPYFQEKKLKISTSDCAVNFVFSLKNIFQIDSLIFDHFQCEIFLSYTYIIYECYIGTTVML